MLKYELTGCYGCEACSQACPVAAIKMVTNPEGFLYPLINTQRCIECNLCNTVCPIGDENLNLILHPRPLVVYAGWNKSLEKVSESTSGGVFAVLAEHILSMEGVVYGCAWRAERLEAFHTRVTTLQALKALKGSKYVQSRIGNVYINLKADLEQNKPVLFSGTPCQVAGLRLFLRKNYPTLYTVDLVCHGVPSPLMFSEYIGWLERKRKAHISHFKFRDQKMNDRRSYVSWVENETKKKMTLTGLQPYSFGFYQSYLSRNACYTCAFSTDRRVADITLSDFWGAEKHHPELKNARSHGFNMIACNTKKGIRLLRIIQPQISCMESNWKYAVDGDVRLRQAEARPWVRDVIYAELRSRGFDHIAHRYLKPRFILIHKLMPLWLKDFIKKIQDKYVR